MSRGSHHHYHQHCRSYDEKKPLILSTYLDAQEHLPFADDSTAATPLWSEENGAIIVHHTTMHHHHSHGGFGYSSRHSSYNSHASRLSYNSHDLLARGGGGGGAYVGYGVGANATTKESQLKQRSKLCGDALERYYCGEDGGDAGGGNGNEADLEGQGKGKRRSGGGEREDLYAVSHQFHAPSSGVDMKDVLVLNDIIDQAARTEQAQARRISDIGEDGDWKNLIKQKLIEGCFRCIGKREMR